MTDQDITQKQALELFRYDPVTGYLHWRVSRSNIIKVGDRAGNLNSSTGYIRIRLNRKNYAAHRLIWFMNTGSWPAHQIDHINHIKHDNRMENLRDECESGQQTDQENE